MASFPCGSLSTRLVGITPRADLKWTQALPASGRDPSDTSRAPNSGPMPRGGSTSAVPDSRRRVQPLRDQVDGAGSAGYTTSGAGTGLLVCLDGAQQGDGHHVGCDPVNELARVQQQPGPTHLPVLVPKPPQHRRISAGRVVALTSTGNSPSPTSRTKPHLIVDGGAPVGDLSQVVQCDPPRRTSLCFRYDDRLNSVQLHASGVLRWGDEIRPFFLEREQRAVDPSTMAARLAAFLRYYASPDARTRCPAYRPPSFRRPTRRQPLPRLGVRGDGAR